MFFQLPFSTSDKAQAKVPTCRARCEPEAPGRTCHEQNLPLVDPGAECSLGYGKPEKFHSPSADIDGGQNVKGKVVSLPLKIRRLPPVRMYAVYVSPVLNHILGIDVLQSIILQTSVGGISSPSACGEGCCEGLLEASPTVTAGTLQGNSCETIAFTRWP